METLRSGGVARSGDRPQRHLFPFAGELQGALADGFAEGLVRREGGEPFGLRLALVSQEVRQTQGLTLSSQRSGVWQFRIQNWPTRDIGKRFGDPVGQL